MDVANLHDRTALVTGAGSGIGRASASPSRAAARISRSAT